MNCPKCNSSDISVLEKRNPKKGIIRRRRMCKACRFRFTTYEILKELYRVYHSKGKLGLKKRKKPLQERAKQEEKQRVVSKKALEFIKKFGITKLR